MMQIFTYKQYICIKNMSIESWFFFLSVITSKIRNNVSKTCGGHLEI